MINHELASQYTFAGTGSIPTFLCYDCHTNKDARGRQPIRKGIQAYRCAACIPIAAAARAERIAAREAA